MALCLENGADEAESVLHLLSTGSAGALATVVCFPPSAGNAVNFRPLARELEESGYALYGVEPPGHDLRRGDQVLAAVEETAGRVAREVLARAVEPIVLYGQGSGTATALATAALLQGQGADLRHVFLSGWSPGDAGELSARIRESSGTSDAKVREHLSADLGYIELGEGREERTHLLGAAYRHDESDAARYLLEASADAVRARVRAPVTVLVADDDPAAEELWASASGWKRFADSVHVRTLSGGGRQHFRSSPAETAAVLTAVAGTGAGQGDR
ncbi:thioesterase domain-containing protein [Nocardiopsis sp. ARC36]